MMFSVEEFVGMSCAFAALQLSKLDPDRRRGAELVLKGCALQVGLLVCRAQSDVEEKLSRAEESIAKLKLQRAEDAKANDKVVGIFAAHEQNWVAERKRLAVQIRALLHQLRCCQARNQENVQELSRRIDSTEHDLEEETKKRISLEEELATARSLVEELRETSANQEAELEGTLRQLESSKQEIHELSEQKTTAVSLADNLSGELTKLQKDAEQKDKIMSAVLRKLKLDTAENHMLLKEVKIAKAKKKLAELEVQRWRNGQESIHKRGWRALEAEISKDRRCNGRTLLLDYLDAETRRGNEVITPRNFTTSDCYHHALSQGEDEIAPVDDVQQLKEWVRMETEKYAMVIRQNHYAELDAFTEQMRLKDEKVENLNWRLVSMEVEAKGLHSSIEDLNGNISHLREENIRLETLLIDREKKLESLKEQLDFHLQFCKKSNFPTNLQALWSGVKVIKKIPMEKEPKTNAKLVIYQERTEKHIELTFPKQDNLEEMRCRESFDADIVAPCSTRVVSPNNSSPVVAYVCMSGPISEELSDKENQCQDEVKSLITTTHDVKEEIEEEIQEEKDICIEQGHVQVRETYQGNTVNESMLIDRPFARKDITWKTDIHALGVSYKIKRLKQQLHVLENLVGGPSMNQTIKDNSDGTLHRDIKPKFDLNSKQMKEFLLLMSFLTKQVQRYQSLEQMTDDLCRRMHENSRSGDRNLQGGRSREQIEVLQGFLEETFQLQRFMVATGQKLMEVQSRIVSCFVCTNGLDESPSFNVGQFADVVKNLFRDIQRGLELRIARIIGDIEGTLAFDVILR